MNNIEAVKEILLHYYEADYYPNIRYDYARQIDALCQQRIIYWRGLLEQVMCEYYADGLTEQTEEQVMTALKGEPNELIE
jgi:hypothetical protein